MLKGATASGGGGAEELTGGRSIDLTTGGGIGAGAYSSGYETGASAGITAGATTGAYGGGIAAGTAGGDPIAGVTEPGLGSTAGYATLPDPGTSYAAPASTAPLDEPYPAGTNDRGG